ncbi:MAG TPA: GNAT family N-acetyltransferase [Longimicrobium sp.]|nr:GNAT family N-acetyltransferase [Longimicrobium sp.]
MLVFRETRLSDIDACFSVRERTRENAILRERLAAIGITPESSAAGLEAGRVKGWVCEDDGEVVGFCSGDTETGEVLVLAVLPEYEGTGVGRRLLAEVVRELRAQGHGRLWLAASADPAHRSHGFYRAQGWKPTGEVDAHGDEILVLDGDELLSTP